MPRHARQPSGTQDHYPQHLAVPMTSSPMYVQPREQLQSNFSFNMPPSSGAMSLATQQQLPPFETYTQSTATPVVPPMQQRPSSGAWSPSDDQQLLQARVQNLSWAEIREQYFPSKTPNACRKRHERLMERKGADDWDNRKMQNIAQEYMKMRKDIWRGLADRCGEKWSVVEHKCMSNGLKNLQSHARQASRRERNGANSSFSGYDDDSGISGIGLTPVDELDVSYSSPDTTSSSAGARSASSSNGGYQHPNPYPSPHHQQNNVHAASHHLQTHAVTQSHVQLQSMGAVHQQQQQQQQQQQPQYNIGYGGYGHQYSSSVGSSTSAYGQSAVGAVEGENGSSPFMNGGRQSSVDMGIGSIINRPNGV